MAGGGGGEEASLEFTPTWVVAVVCSVIVFLSLVVERFLSSSYLKRKNKKPLFEALQKVKEELMLLGFISLTVFQGTIQRVCIPESLTRHLLLCRKKEGDGTSTSHFQSAFFSGILGSTRRLLAGGDGGSDHCARTGKVPLLSLEAVHDLHIFVFVLAVAHVSFCVLTMLLAGARIRQWKRWEDSIQREKESSVEEEAPKVTHVSQNEFIRKRFMGLGKDSAILSWLRHCKGNPKFNFHKYMVRALEADFKRVVGISWHLWIFVIIFLLLNISGWDTYFWMAFIPLLLLLAVGAKLEHVITQWAHEVAEKHSAIEGDLVVKPSDDHFWFNRPRIVLYLIHFILFQNAFEIAFFFFVLTRYSFHSCIMGRVSLIIPRLVIGGLIQLLCSYSTLPLYAIVTQMGSSFKKAIFDEHVQEGLVGWAQKAKKRKGVRVANGENTSSRVGSGEGSGTGIPLQNLMAQPEIQMEEGNMRLGNAHGKE